MKKIVIAGGTGFLGKCLSRYFLEQGYQVYILSRNEKESQTNLHYCIWDGKTSGRWEEVLEDVEAVINLSGKSVDCRYNERNKKLIYSSRLEPTRILGKAISSCKKPPKVWINAASATIYRHSLDKSMDEETGEIGTGFSVDVCQKWEREFNAHHVPGTRKVILRTSIVLGKEGGAFQPLKNLARFGLGGKQGPGNQYFSWIHEDDFVEIVHQIINNEEMEGIYNIVSPNPVQNYELMEVLRKCLKMPIGLPMPTWLLKIGALLINTETELILKSRYVFPQRLMDEGYKFKYPNLKDAVEELVENKKYSL